LLLYESGSGGNLFIQNNDLVLVESLYQQCYLALFGGNLEADTTGEELPTQLREDWWGNELFSSKKPNQQFNSKTERVLDSVTLNTAGRNEIERAVKDDLKVLKNVSTFSVNIVILDVNKVKIEIGLIKPNKLQNKSFQFIWDNAAGEIIKEIVI